MRNKIIPFDIETTALPESEIRRYMPQFTAPANYKDAEKIAANIAEQQTKWLGDAALSAVTGRVLVVGAMVNGEFRTWEHEDEPTLLREWWQVCGDWIRSGYQLVGHFAKGFDLPFLIRRSWRYRIDIPICIWDGRYLNGAFLDTCERWACGGREKSDRISLDNLSLFLETGQKTGNGRDFGALWRSDKTAALTYLKQDLTLTAAAYERMWPSYN